MSWLDVLSVCLSVLAICLAIFWRLRDEKFKKQTYKVDRYNVNKLKEMVFKDTTFENNTKNTIPVLFKRLTGDEKIKAVFSEMHDFVLNGIYEKKLNKEWVNFSHLCMLIAVDKLNESDDETFVILINYLFKFNLLNNNKSAFDLYGRPFHFNLILPQAYFSYVDPQLPSPIVPPQINPNITKGVWIDGGTTCDYKEIIHNMHICEALNAFDKESNVEHVDPTKIKNLLLHPRIPCTWLNGNDIHPSSPLGLSVIPSLCLIRLFTPDNKIFITKAGDASEKDWHAKQQPITTADKIIRCGVAWFENIGVFHQEYICDDALIEEIIEFDINLGIIKIKKIANKLVSEKVLNFTKMSNKKAKNYNYNYDKDDVFIFYVNKIPKIICNVHERRQYFSYGAYTAIFNENINQTELNLKVI